jgi:hypothetical protein
MFIHCPECHGLRIHRSRRRGLLESRLFAMLFIRPFRCLACDHRFFRWSLNANPSPQPSEPLRTS